MLFAAMAAAQPAFALPAVRPVLPPVARADTETATNVPFTAWERGMRSFRFDLEFAGTASNDVEMAFGVDADGDGELSDGEADVIAGWDCGELFVADNAGGGRFAEPAPDGRHVLSCVCETRSDGRVLGVAFTCDGRAVFAGLAAARPAWLHSTKWDVVRLVGRGEGVRAGERFSAKVSPAGSVLTLR